MVPEVCLAACLTAEPYVGAYQKESSGKSFPDTKSGSFSVQLVELGRSSIAGCRMPALAVIKCFDVLEDLLLGLLPDLETAMMDQPRFEGMKEALGRSAVPAVASATHTADVTIVFQHRLEAA